MKKYIKLFLAMTLVIISMFSSAKLNTTSALGATGAINITGQSITPTKNPVDQYTDINVNMNFSVPSTAKTGGQAIISLPKNLKFVSDTNFNVMSSDNKIVAKAVLNAASKTITLTYTDYVTKKSDIKGSLFFNVRVSPDTASPSKVPINISVNNKNIPVGNVNFVVDPGNSDKVLDKVSWNTQKLADGGITRDYEVRVNADNRPLTNAIVLDKLNTDGMSYVKDSFVIKKGTWAVSSNHKLGLKNATVVSVPVNFDASQKSFQVNLGNVAANEGYSIYYKVKIDKTPKNGKQFLNNVTLKADKVTETKSNPFVYQNAGGEAEGYNYSVKIKKVDSETNAALAGASFDVIRTSTNETVKSVTTDANGEALIDGLLNTEYKLVETKAPEGYQLNKEAIVVKTTDFNSSKVALKTISNKKIPKEPTPANATIELDKQLSGRDLVDGEFSFELYEGSNKIQTVSNKNGKITFDAISYKEVGEHTYTVKEVKGDNSTIAYDSSSKQVTVKVTKDGDKLKSEVVYPDGNTFNNKFTPNAANATIELDKALSGRDLVDGEFSFELYEGSNYQAGEFGHFIINKNSNFVCKCGKTGCIEAEFSEKSIKLMIMQEYEKSTLTSFDDKYTIKQIYERAKVDPLFKKPVSIASYRIGEAVGNIMNVLDIGDVIVLGELIYSGDVFLENFKKGIHSSLTKEFGARVNVCTTGLGENAEKYGALSLIMINLFSGLKLIK